jgi:hypothetical protein
VNLDNPVVFMAVFCALAAIVGGLLRSRTVILTSVGLFACWAVLAIAMLIGGASG